MATDQQLSKDPGFRASRPDTKGTFTLHVYYSYLK